MGMVIGAVGLVLVLGGILLGIIGVVATTLLLRHSKQAEPSNRGNIHELLSLIITLFAMQILIVRIGKQLFSRPIPPSIRPVGISEEWVSAMLNNMITTMSVPLVIGVIFFLIGLGFSVVEFHSSGKQQYFRPIFRGAALGAFLSAAIPMYWYYLVLS